MFQLTAIGFLLVILMFCVLLRKLHNRSYWNFPCFLCITIITTHCAYIFGSNITIPYFTQIVHWRHIKTLFHTLSYFIFDRHEQGGRTTHLQRKHRKRRIACLLVTSQHTFGWKYGTCILIKVSVPKSLQNEFWLNWKICSFPTK